MLEIKKAKYIEDFKIWVLFNNSVEGIAELADILWGDMFEPLRIIDNFKNLRFSKP